MESDDEHRVQRQSRAVAAIAQRRTQSLTSIVQKELESMILSGEVKTGARVNEQRLAKLLGVSRGPIREAVTALESAGLLESAANRGMFVRRVSMEELLELYDIRALLTGFACERLAERGTPEQIAELRAAYDRMSCAVQQKDPKTYYENNVAFHNALLAHSGHKKALEIYNSLLKQTHLSREYVLAGNGNMEESNAEHARILEAIENRDTTRAREIGENHALGGRRRLMRYLKQ